MDLPSKAKTASSAKSKPKKRYVKPELKRIPPSTAKAILEEKARGDSSAEKMLRHIRRAGGEGSNSVESAQV